MSSVSYIRATGDPDYNFGYNDFTVEMFVETSNTSASPQTLFEITNNAIDLVNTYSMTRFFTVLENGNINAYATQDASIVNVAANIPYFITPTRVNSNYRVFYNNQLLESNQYSAANSGLGSNVTLSNIPISTSPTTAAVSLILFDIEGGQFSGDTMHFVSAERYKGDFYLFLDGQAQAVAVNANVAIPTQILANIANANSNIVTVDAPALLTIGANRDGEDPLFGSFGDIRITNGKSRHVPFIEPTDKIISNFPDPFVGTDYANIIVNGGNFVDNTTSYGPEELVEGQMFDTLFIQTYQSSTSNASANVLSFIFFKPTIMAGPTGSYSFTVGSSNANIPVPWSTLDSAAASVLVNGTALPAIGQWYVISGKLTVNAQPGDNVQVISTGPTNYYAVGANTISNITTNLYASDSTINVANIAVFTIPAGSIRGQVFVNQECISYSSVNTGNSTLSGLVRGAAGTGTPNIHLSGARIVCAGIGQDLANLTNVDPRPVVWYATPFNNTSLQNTSTTISNKLLFFGGIPPLPVF